MLEAQSQRTVYTDLSDTPIQVDILDDGPTIVTNELYKKQVERFIRENKHHITISKLNTNQVITPKEIEELQRILFDGGERGTYDQYKEAFGEQPLGVFIRSIVGLDVQAAQAAFSDFLQAGNFSADQMKFIDNIVSHLSQNGTIDKRFLFQPPFNNRHEDGLIGIFDEHLDYHRGKK